MDECGHQWTVVDKKWTSAKSIFVHNCPLMSIGFLLMLFLTACERQSERPILQSGEYIIRSKQEFRFIPPSQNYQAPVPHPWHIPSATRINQYHFRCKGSVGNSAITIEKEEGKICQFDCEGSLRHSLPIREDKEFIYPILVDLLNYLQDTTGHSVVITSGHRCPDHNTYVDSSPSNQFSKHQIGAEVDFYVEGMETAPLKVIDCIQKYYSKKNEAEVFKRYEKEDVLIRTKPWYNKEIFIKLYQSDEGRNFDNRHAFPYISIQVRWDRDKQEKVNYSWQKAFYGFQRK